MTWPLARVIERGVSNPGDPYINTWILDWDYFATFVSPRPLFDANIFHPSRLALAFSENLFGLAMIAAPLRAAGVTPLAAHNILQLLGFALCGFSAYLLAAFATGSRGAALVAGIAYAFIPWRFTHLPHLQHAWTATLPLLLLALLAYARVPSLRRACAVGAVVLVSGAINLHVFAFGLVAAAATTLLLLVVQPQTRSIRWLAPLAIAVVVACLALLPLLLPYRRVMNEVGFRGDRAETARYSASPSDWLLTNFHNRLYLQLDMNDGTTDPERWLFPGFGILALSLWGQGSIWALAATRSGKSTLRSREGPNGALTPALLWIVLGFVGSLGLSFVFHDFLFEHVSLFRGIRVPARWATVTHVGLAITAAFGALRLIRGRIAITALLCVALLAELRSAPIRYVMAPTLTPEVYRWLANARTSAVLELPIGDAAAEYEYMLRATAHRKRTVNGISGFAPDSFESIAREFRSPRASDDLATTLASRGVDLILVHGDRLGSQGASIVDFLRRNLASGRLSFVRNFEDGRVGDYVFRIERTPVRELPTNVRRFLDGQPVLNRGPFGVLDTPGYNVAVDGALSVVGWAVAAEGVQQVNLRFNNGAVVVPATLWERPDVRALYPGSVGFRAEFPKRPPGVSRATDIEVEVIDRRGVRSLVPDRWFIWN